MEDGGGFVSGNLQKNHLLYDPPLTTLERFLSGQNNHLSHENDMVASWFSLQPSSDQETASSFLDGIFVDEELLEWEDQERSREAMTVMKSSSVGKRTKRASRAALIKGQWTDEEDRKLIKLVKQYGMRKWAQIAEKMVGRAGKQCRERWHNHLRPDIKKDSWSEEEERILVEAHEKVGNKWAEIAKRIPGRSENSIKNHWNATKRRQNSRRKHKQSQNNQNGKPQSSILQDYIRSKNNLVTTTITNNNNNVNDTNQPIDFGPTPSTTSCTTVSDHDPSNINNPCDDELFFMQNLFANHHNVDKSNFNNMVSIKDQFVTSNVNVGPVLDSPAMSTQLYSDLYLSYLLNGTASVSSVSTTSFDMGFGTEGDQIAYCSSAGNDDDNGGNKEMDLMEMVSSSQGSNYSGFSLF